MNSPVLQVVIFRDGSPVGSEVFLPGEYSVGSHHGCELVLADPRWPPFHARLSFRGGKIRLSDLGRVPAGMRINGRPLNSGEVWSRDNVAVGPFLLRFRVMGNQRLASVEEGASPARPTNTAGPLNPPPIAPQPTPVAAAPAELVRPSPHAPPREREPAHAAARPAAALLPALAPAPEPLAEDAPRPSKRPAAAPEPRPHHGASHSRPSASADVPPSMPSLRVRVFWGHTMVGIHGFSFGQKAFAEAREKAGLPVYGLALPEKRFLLAFVHQGVWTIRVPPGMTVHRFENSDWRPVAAASDGDSGASLIPMDPGEVVRMGDARHSMEARVDRVPAVPRKSIREQVDPQLGIPLGILSVLAIAAMIAMPHFERKQADFVPKQLAPVRALLKPPEKKKLEKKKQPDEKKEQKEEKVAKEKPPREVPHRKRAAVKANTAIRAVEKTAVAVRAVESLLKATSKIASGPKGYGDKGMGFKISPLIGKPPIAQAGIGFEPGMGGFGTATKGIGGMRGMGRGGRGIGAFATGGIGRGKVAGTVVSANVRKAQIRGQLDRELIAKVINEHMGEIRSCYERALLKEAGLAGKLNLEWTIETSGIVSAIGVKNTTLRGPEVPNCIIEHVRKWVFPKPKGGEVVIRYPFLFNSVGF